jgi:hypothetical protein
MPIATYAEVPTERASAYLKQLCKHFRHRHSVTFSDSVGTMTFPFGVCRLHAHDGRLVLVGETADPEKIDYLERVIGGHLERFGRRDALDVSWRRVTGEPAIEGAPS